MRENNIAKTVDSLLVAGEGRKFYSFSNADAKQWIIPRHNMSTAMRLYQPGATNGRLMRRWFPYLCFAQPLRRKLKISTHRYDLHYGLKKLLEGLFNAADLEFSIFCGTPSIHQKITMQVSRGNQILGYCKFTADAEIKKIFRHERSILDLLEEKRITSIPQALYCGPLKDDIDIFVQTTMKTKQSKVSHRIGKPHWDFLSTLYAKTACKTAYSHSGLYQTLAQLTTLAQDLPAAERLIIARAIGMVHEHYGGQVVDFCLYHGDFTPWNSFVAEDGLFVFDWEYGRFSFPPYMDVFHYETQCHIFGKTGMPPCDKTPYFASDKEQNIVHVCYLLTIIAFYLARDKAGDNRDARQKRLNLLRQISEAVCPAGDIADGIEKDK